MAVTHLAAYDVSENQRRARLAALLQAFGDRIQKSVFLISVDVDELKFITKQAAVIIDEDSDSLWVLHQCVSCWETVARVGQAEAPSPTRFWAVM